MQYFEDIEVGSTARFGDYAVTRDEVIAFAEKYDPSPFTCPTQQRRRRISGGCRRAAGIRVR